MPSVSFFFDSNDSILIDNEGDHLCVHLKFGVKVFIKADKTFMIKNFNDKNSFAMCGELDNAQPIFSFQRKGVKAHHARDDSLNIKVDVNDEARKYVARICHTAGKYRIVENMSSKFQHLFRYMSCVQVFDFKPIKVTREVAAKMKLLVDSCQFYKNEDSAYVFRFRNGMTISQDPFGYTRVFFSDGAVMMMPRVSLEVEFKSFLIFSDNRLFFSEKEGKVMTVIDNSARAFQLKRSVSCSDLLEY